LAVNNLSWTHLLTANITSPGRPDKKTAQIHYYFNNKSSTHKLIGGSPKSNVTFTITDESFQILNNVLDLNTNQ